MVRIFSPHFVLLLITIVGSVAFCKSLVRKRREWILPPRPLKENEDYTKKEFIAKIRSDFEEHKDIIYTLKGRGADQDPYNVFVVDSRTGFIRVTRILDREYIDTYNLSGIATFINGSKAENKIDIRVKVVDENDNSPVFPRDMKPGAVYERSPAGTSVITVKATDLDEPGNPNSQMSYSLVRQEPADDTFYMKSDGTIYVKNDLDRETTDRYVLTVKAVDRNGDPRGNTGTGTITINIKDVNDNLPTLSQSEFSAKIKENTYGVEVMRFKAEDRDLVKTANWETEYIIARGNEAGYFSIKTDPKTNEGILFLEKAVDYEDIKNLDLGVILKNKAPLFDDSVGFTNIDVGGELTSTGTAGIDGGTGGTGGIGGTGGTGGIGGTGGTEGTGGTGGTVDNGATGASSFSGLEQIYNMYTVKVAVENEPEGPRFEPKVKAIPISEGDTTIKVMDTIGHYPAIDQDTGKPAKNVRYVKGTDTGNWLVIDSETAEIKLNKLPDRESTLLVNGTYYAEILCISDDMPAKTATGTIAIQVEDFNDHCPTLTSTAQTLCLTDDAILINAQDRDAFPNGPPFHFTIVPENTQGKWQVQHLNDTGRILRREESLWPGVYQVEFIVTDQQGKSCPEPQRVQVQVCTCEDGFKCGKRGGRGQPEKEVEFGPAGIGLLFLGLLLLLLIPLLALFCFCGGIMGSSGAFAEMPFDTKSHLINYHTEGQGENTEVPLINMQSEVGGNTHTGYKGWTQTTNEFYQGQGASQMDGTWKEMSHMDGTWSMNQMGGSGFQSEYMSREREGGIFDGMALPYHYLGQYYNQKAQTSDALAGKENLLVYDYEGQGSCAGSLGSCDNLAVDNDLHFLNDLDFKFKTLAEICEGKTLAEVRAPAPPTTSISTSINSHTAVSSVLAPGPLPQPVPKPRSIPKAEVSSSSSSKVQESSESTQTVTIKDVSQEVSRGPAPQAPQAPQGQVLLLQQQPQPQLYYTTAPVLQPNLYMVQNPVQNTVLLREAPGTNVQNVMLVNGPQSVPAQGLVMQGQTVMQGQAVGQTQVPGMVLVENAHGPGASLSGSQTMVLVDGKGLSGAKQVLKTNQNLVKTGLSGSQTLLVVGSNSAQGQQPGAKSSLSTGLSGSLRTLNKSSSSSTGNLTGNTTPSTSRRVVIQETRKVVQTNL
ncbi:hypothetical protein NL108_009549 [Boleophthalmus pectinirostris]|uniref:desmoglein-2.1-like n=1 Tax=Boleophthalmus pectinirostris TaxID=150288 RepID=UPI002430AD61|nr:desmoglein-2.1-like [Boleophthalmus pectinirostris]KAJ0065393.1 hypothetical protein NL108_009549 [Boleophthalmus pectinirostris]